MSTSARPLHRMIGGALVAAIALVGCSKGDGESVVLPTPAGETTTTVDAGALFTESESDGSEFDGSESGGSEDGDAIDAVVESIEPVSETGVPGIDSDDDFCRAWSTFAGSIRALSFVWTVQGSGSAASLEVAASDALVSSVEALGEHLPAELEGNRQALTVDVPAPWLRRAARAQQLLANEGANEQVIEALGVVWTAALAEYGVDDENIEIKVPVDANEALPAAAAAFASELPPVVDDPTLDTTAFDISPSLIYIADNCPDRGTLAGNDNVDSS